MAAGHRFVLVMECGPVILALDTVKSVYVVYWYEAGSFGSKHKGRDQMSNKASILVSVVLVQRSPPRCQRVTNSY